MNGNVILGRSITRLLLVLIGLAMLVPNVGCRLCCDTEDLAYPAYGGAWQRTRRDDGRVGSLFDPAGGKTAVLTSRDEPKSVDELYRNRTTDPKSDADPDKNSDGDEKNAEPIDPRRKPSEDQDAELKRRAEELKKLELEDIDLVPGEPLPPDLN